MKPAFLILFLFVLFSFSSSTGTKGAQRNLLHRKLVLTSYKFRTEILQKMNKVREKHHAKALIWDTKLADKAQKKVNVGKSNPNNIEVELSGETVFIYYQNNYIDLNYVVDSWEKEEEKYNYDNPGYEEYAAMFTQLVWKEAKKVGCGFSSELTKKKDYLNIVICQFDPRGNIEFEEYGKDKKSYQKLYRDNVLPQELKAEEEDDGDEILISYDDYMKTIYERMNFYREKHQAPKVTKSKLLEKKALEMAKDALKNGEVGESSKYGINYLETEVYMDDPNVLVDYMYNQKEGFNFGTLEFTDDATLFMQLVWKSSRSVGCAMEKDKQKSLYAYVCLFDPGMNERDYAAIAKNVLLEKTETETKTEVLISYDDYMKEIYERMNFYRKQHSSPKLTKSKRLEEKASEFAKDALIKGEVQDSTVYGINYLETEVYMDDPNVLVDYMYNQKEGFNFGTLEFSDDATLFMQLVWKNSRNVGCGMEKDAEKNLFAYVCLFEPKMKEQDYAAIAKNVLPKESEGPKKATGDIEKAEDKEDNKDIDGEIVTIEVGPWNYYDYEEEPKDTTVYVNGKKVGSEFHHIYPYDTMIVNHKGTLEQLFKNILTNIYFKINYYRKIHGVRELVIDKALADAAHQSVEDVIKNKEFYHSLKYNNSEVSENFCKFNAFPGNYEENDVPSTIGINNWYDEIKIFNYNNPEVREGTDQFTAMIWKNSTKVGCGVDREDVKFAYQYYVVCMFWPPGNIQGYFNSEVLKPLYDEPQENLYIKNK